MEKMWRMLGSWLLPSLMGCLFVLIGLGKFQAPGWQRNFERWGYPDGAYAVVGAAEIAGGLLLLWPRLTPWSAGGLGVILLGAIGTHLYWGEPDRLVNPVLYLVLLAVSAYARRPGARQP